MTKENKIKKLIANILGDEKITQDEMKQILKAEAEKLKETKNERN